MEQENILPLPPFIEWTIFLLSLLLMAYLSFITGRKRALEQVEERLLELESAAEQNDDLLSKVKTDWEAIAYFMDTGEWKCRNGAHAKGNKLKTQFTLTTKRLDENVKQFIIKSGTASETNDLDDIDQ